MWKRNKNINDFLKTMAKIYIQNPDIPITYDSIYHYLTRVKESNKAIKPYHAKWVNDFRNVPNIDVFVAENWQYFCQFNNDSGSNIKDEHIKLYLPIDVEHIDQVATDLFRFLAANNIYHHSKIGSDERRDVIVIRLESEKDLPILQDFVKKNKNIKKGLMTHNPFVMNDGILGYASDGSLSYNSVVSQYVKNYLQYKKYNNSLENVSLKDFLEYCKSIYNSCFIETNSNNLEWFITNFNVRCDVNLSQMDYESKEKYISRMAPILNNYNNVSRLIITALQTNDLEYFHRHFNEVCDVNKKYSNESRLRIMADSEMRLIQECLEHMIKKYGTETAVKYMIEYAKTGDTSYLTSDKNYREIIYMSYDIETYTTNLNHILRTFNLGSIQISQSREIKKVDDKKNNISSDIVGIIKRSVDETVLKQNNVTTQEQLITLERTYTENILRNILENNNYAYITSRNDARKDIYCIGQDGIYLEIIKGAITKYVIDCMQKNKNNYSCGDPKPRSVEESVNFITSVIFEKSVDEAYDIVTKTPEIREFLIRNYARLVTDTTKEIRQQALSSYSIPNLPKLDAMQQRLIEINQAQINNAGISY